MREFEDRFVTLGLPYRVIGGPRFYERQEIRDALAYLRVVHSPANDLAFERIVNVPKRGLGDATVQLLHDHARRRRIPLTEASRAVVETDELKPKARNSLRTLMESFDRWRLQKDALPHTELAEIILDEFGYTEMWQKDRSADAAGRLDNLKELIRSMDEFENLAGFLEHISLVMDRDQGEDLDAVSIMTLHSAKGLEFDTVFLPGWEEGVFPNQRALDDQGRAGLEEERRLAHVGLTRARRRAKIYFASNRRMHGLWNSNIPSRFLDELPEAHVAVMEAQGRLRRGRRLRQCRRLALRRDDAFRLGLHHARLAARAGAAREIRALQQLRRTRLRRGRLRRRAARLRRGRRSFFTSPLAGEVGRRRRQVYAVCAHLERRPGGGYLESDRRLRPRPSPRPAHHRGRTGRQIDRHRLRLLDRRPRLPFEIRQRQRHRHRRQQAHHRVRQGRRETGGG